MERGLMWLPLLAVFIWLAWAGWNEYQKVEAYRIWAQQFGKVKYDIYAVLGQNGDSLTWGKPTRKGPVNLQTFSLQDVDSIEFLVNNQSVDLQKLPSSGRDIALGFLFKNASVVRIPFTEIDLAAEWEKHLQQELERLKLG
ncbi:hypothetical protein PN499_08435 [Kamptonema animale CS-326]|uniref:hypothetical protein n=1 Tax=Kamptonema animale TaxID=92934 RepID=UPI00232B5835|nr:hypothetical protein [Kamptonema animale]MDB9511207.1 hypothetical protein [Kamptonema animale CS-326]